MTDLDDQIRQHYAGKQLTPSRLAAIAQNSGQSKPRWTWGPVFATAAVLLIGFAIYTTSHDRLAMTHQVLEEIAMNHAKGLDVEVASADFGVVQSALERIGFDLRPGEQTQRDFQLIGGRYCSIRGQLAAQLKMRSIETGLSHTLYVTRLNEPLASIQQGVKEWEDVKIRLWQADGRFFGMASGGR